jgi:hypothetical protein
MQDLRSLTDDELAEVYGSGDEAVQTAVLREAARRDRKAAQTACDKERWAAVQAQWMEWAQAQFVAAETACRGYLLNKAGRSAGVDPWSLWSGPVSHARRYASEELMEFWATNPRLTVSQFREELRRERREQQTA